MRRLAFAMGAAALAAASPAAAANAEAPVAGGCFRVFDVVNHTVGGGYMYLELASRGVYRVTAAGACLKSALPSDPVALGPADGRASVCRASDLELAVRGNRCVVQAITPMSAAEVASLPKKLRP